MIISDKMAQEIKELHKELDSKGELFSNAQLSQYHDNFRVRFSPDILRNLDGEALLETIHNQSD